MANAKVNKNTVAFPGARHDTECSSIQCNVASDFEIGDKTCDTSPAPCAQPWARATALTMAMAARPCHSPARRCLEDATCVFSALADDLLVQREAGVLHHRADVQVAPEVTLASHVVGPAQ